MQREKQEWLQFMQNCPPLNQLETSLLQAFCETAEIIYLRVDETLLKSGQENAFLYLIRKGALSVYDVDGQLENHLDVGDWAGYSALFHKGIIQKTIKTREDCLLYRFPLKSLDTLMQQAPSIKSFFAEHKTDRLRQAVLDYRGDSQTQLISSKIEDIKTRPSLIISEDTSIQESARLMSQQKRSALLIVDHEKQLKGLVTEADFCNKVVAAGLDSARPITDIMTLNPTVVSAQTRASDALLLMATHDIHHLPFRRKTGEYSTLTAADLIHFQSHNPLFLIREIYAALSLDELVQHSKKIPDLFTDLVYSSLAADDIGHLISAVGDAINQRLIQLAEQALGQAPVPYAWLVAGSLARREQSINSDQDNALIISDAYQSDSHGDYFAQLSQWVSDGLAACRYPYCPGNIMATNPKWRKTVSEWRAQFQQWIHQVSPESILYSTIFFDMRTLIGDSALFADINAEVLATAGKQAAFMTHLAENALQFSPPLGLFRHFVLEHFGTSDKAFNLKQRGGVPITDLARVHALAAQSPALNTRERLQAAADAQVISQGLASDLLDAYALINSVRLRHQAKQLERRESVNNFVAPASLSSLERAHLKDAFDVVVNAQKYLRQRY